MQILIRKEWESIESFSDVVGVPSIVKLIHGKKSKEYNGPRKHKDILQWILDSEKSSLKKKQKGGKGRKKRRKTRKKKTKRRKRTYRKKSKKH